MGRSDTQLVVRQASLHVWKIVVSNTPRTLREILPTLFTLLLGFLASTWADKRTVPLLSLYLMRFCVYYIINRLRSTVFQLVYSLAGHCVLLCSVYILILLCQST